MENEKSSKYLQTGKMYAFKMNRIDIAIPINSMRECKVFDNVLSIEDIKAETYKSHSGQHVNNFPGNGMAHISKQNFPRLGHGPCQIF